MFCIAEEIRKCLYRHDLTAEWIDERRYRGVAEVFENLHGVINEILRLEISYHSD